MREVKRIDEFELPGQKFHRLTIDRAYRTIKKEGSGTTEVRCDVTCECGEKREGVLFLPIKYGQKKSCGCLKHQKPKGIKSGPHSRRSCPSNPPWNE